MDTTLGVTNLSKDEQHEVGGDSMKVVVVIAAFGGIACKIGSYVASQTGYPTATA